MKVSNVTYTREYFNNFS